MAEEKGQQDNDLSNTTQKTKDWATQTIQRKEENGGALFLQMHSSFLVSGSWKTSFSKGQGCCILVYINHFYFVSPDLLNESLVLIFLWWKWPPQ